MANGYIKSRLIQKYGNYCMLCGKKLKRNEQTYHHIKPKSYKGQATEENGAILCPVCHQKIHKYEFESEEYFDLTLQILNNKLKYKR